MRRQVNGLRGLAVFAALLAMGAAPAAPSYLGIERAIDGVREGLAAKGAAPQPNAPGWSAFFDALKAELAAYGAATTEDARLRSLGRLHGMSGALRGVSWAPAAGVREALREWLAPRVKLAWAGRRLVDSVNQLPATPNPATVGNRDRWVKFVGDDLGEALRTYEGAQTVRDRRAALTRVYGALNSLQGGNQSHPWGPSQALQSALDDLFNRPNFDVTADPSALSPALNTNIVESGPIEFKGNLSYVMAGPKLAFGLMPSDEGIAFYNTQALSTVTPIRGFQQQLAADRQGKKAAKLYQFAATSRDSSQLTITAILRPSGLAVAPGYLHNITATVNSSPIEGKGLGRFVAALVGLDQGKITNKVYQAAIGKIVQGVVQGASELGQIKAAQGAAQRNAQLSRALVGNDTLRVKNLEITGLSLRSRPEYALVGGTLRWLGAAEQVGADAPRPPSLASYEPGLTADIHLASVATNMARGYLQTPQSQEAENLLIVTRKVPPGAPAGQGVSTTPNADFAAFNRAIEETKAADDPGVMAIRVKRPGHSPEFSADRDGLLVALVHDFQIEVAAPPNAARGGLAGPPAKIYRITAPTAEFSLSIKVTPPSAGAGGEAHISGRVEAFDPGPGAQVYAILDDESKPTPLPAFTNAVALNVAAGKIKGRPFDVPLGVGAIPGYNLTKVSALDPSGWLRVVLTPNGQPLRVAAH